VEQSPRWGDLPCSARICTWLLDYWRELVDGGVFATLYLADSAHLICPGLAKQAPTPATTHVCALVPNEPGSSEIVFALLVLVDMLTIYPTSDSLTTYHSLLYPLS
jgi:hypothetical protein